MAGAPTPRNLRQRKAATAMVLGGIVCAMIGASFAAVPLYRIFCAATGYAGTTQRAEAAPADAARPVDPAALVTVRFDANISPDLDWDFRPDQLSIDVKPGDEQTVAFHATNRSKEPITGTATFNVTPYKAGLYFNKVQCFCFTKQHLDPGESAELTVSFFVDPDLLTDPGTTDVKTITLSYTMFRAKDDGQPAPQASGAQRPVAQRREAQPSSSVN